MEVNFSKIHGLGNDFLVVNELQAPVIPDAEKPAFAKKHCRRNTSVGGDGILFLCKSSSPKADFKMRIFNADGSEAETCVNGLRCVAFEKFLLDGGKKDNYRIETIQGIAEARISGHDGLNGTVELQLLGKREFKGKKTIEAGGRNFEYFFVDVGNPHAVVFLDEPVENFPVEEVGHKFEFHEDFKPSRTNTEFVNVLSREKVRMRVHERGACETMACGSGSIAIVIAGAEAGLLEKDKWVSVEQPGGILEIRAGKGLFLKGPAQKVFEGKIKG